VGGFFPQQVKGRKTTPASLLRHNVKSGDYEQYKILAAL
jgi:hypothetical protein